MGDLHARRRSRRARGVLQVRDILFADIDGGELIGCRIRDFINHHHGHADARKSAEESEDGVPGRGSGQHQGGSRVGECGLQTFGVAGKFGREQGNRDRPRETAA